MSEKRNSGKRHLKLMDIPRYETLVEAIKKAKKDMEKSRYKLRDLAILSILIYTGCRIGEVVTLRVSDIDIKNRVIRIKQQKKRMETTRVVPIPSVLFWEIMERYLRYLNGTDKLFNITNRQARNIVYTFTKKYLGKRMRPHAIRHSYAVFILRKTRDLETLRRLLGHSNYDWLKDYLDYTQEDLEDDLRRIFNEIEKPVFTI